MSEKKCPLKLTCIHYNDECYSKRGELQEENKALTARIAELEAELEKRDKRIAELEQVLEKQKSINRYARHKSSCRTRPENQFYDRKGKLINKCTCGFKQAKLEKQDAISYPDGAASRIAELKAELEKLTKENSIIMKTLISINRTTQSPHTEMLINECLKDLRTLPEGGGNNQDLPYSDGANDFLSKGFCG